jgi:hypothetical protein
LFVTSGYILFFMSGKKTQLQVSFRRLQMSSVVTKVRAASTLGELVSVLRMVAPTRARCASLDLLAQDYGPMSELTLGGKLEIIDGLLAQECLEKEEALVLTQLSEDLGASILDNSDVRRSSGEPVEVPAAPEETSHMRHMRRMRRVREEAQETRKRLGRPEPTVGREFLVPFAMMSPRFCMYVPHTSPPPPKKKPPRAADGYPVHKRADGGPQGLDRLYAVVQGRPGGKLC